MKSKRILIHVILECKDCNYRTGSLDGQHEAYLHAKKFKHLVTGEAGYAIKYNGREYK